MKSQDHTKKGAEPIEQLIPETIYVTPDAWRGPCVRATSLLPDGSQGWSVFTKDAHILSFVLRKRPIFALNNMTVRETCLFTLPQAQELALSYANITGLIETKATEEETKEVLHRLHLAGYGPQKHEPGHSLTYTFEQFLQDFGMFAPFFIALASNLPVICPDATVTYSLDDEDDFPPQCEIVITVPAHEHARASEEVSKLLLDSLQPLQEAIDLARYEGVLDFQVNVKVAGSDSTPSN